MKFIVVTLGSAGDLHPFLAVARALAQAGHSVELMSNAPYADAVTREGVSFVPLCSANDHARTIAHPDLWHPMRGFGVLWRHLAVPAVVPVRDHLLARLRASGAEGPPVVLASPLAVGARLARAQQAFPLCSLYIAPSNLRSIADPMVLGQWQVPAGLPRFARRALWAGLDRWKLEPLARPLIDRLHADAGLPRPGGSLFGDWIHSPDGGVTLFPAEFCGALDPVRPAVLWGGFPCFEARGDDTLPAALERFLVAGPAPLVVFAGSAGGEAARALHHRARTAAQALGLRVVSLGLPASEAAPLPDGLANDTVLTLPHAPLARLLPRSLAFVHHGGIGSCAQALRARTWQIVCPLAYDQFENGLRVSRLGAGETLLHARQQPGDLLRALQALQPDLAGPRSFCGDGLADTMAALARWVTGLK